MNGIRQHRSDRNALLALAERVLAYKRTGRYDVDQEARRELSECVASALDAPLTVRLGHPILGNERVVPARILDYIGSEDAARKVAPPGWYVRVVPRFYSEEGEVRWRAHAIKPDWSRWAPHDDWFDTIEDIDADEPALAMCAVALMARAAELP